MFEEADGSVEQQLLPTFKDPNIYLIRCQKGQEKQTKKGKAAGPSGVTAKMLQAAAEAGIR